jgi:hypothetical protein
MKIFNLSFRGGMFLAALILLQTHMAWGQDGFPMPERLIKQGDRTSYTRAAQDFLKSHPNSEFAPRVAFDLYMLSRHYSDNAIAEEMEAKLLLDYLETMQGAYFGSTYAKAEDYRKFLTKLGDEYIQNPADDGFPNKYRRALGFGYKKFSSDLLDDKDFVLKSAIVVASTGDTEMQRMLLDQFKLLANKDKDKKFAAIAALAMDETKPLPERILGLHPESADYSSAGLLRDLLFLKLGKDEKNSPALRQVTAEALLDQKRFQAALPLLEQLPIDKAGDKILFQRMWCHAVAGNVKQVAELQARLDKEFPASPWHEPGLKLSRAAVNADSNLALYIETLRTVVGTAKNDVDEFEAKFSYENDKGKKFTAYLGLSFNSKYAEAQLSEGEDLLLAYKSTATDSMVFIKEDQTIRRFLQTGLIPIANVNVVRNLDNTFNMQANVSVHHYGKDNPSSLDSPYLNNPEEIKAMIQNSLRNGALLGNVEESPEGRIFSLLRPKVMKPSIWELRILVTKDNRIVSAQFAPPTGPAVKTITEEEFNPSYLFKMLGSASESLFSDK